MCVHVSACMNAYMHAGAQGSQKRETYPQELERKAAVSLPSIGAGNRTQNSARRASTLNLGAISTVRESRSSSTDSDLPEVDWWPNLRQYFKTC